MFKNVITAVIATVLISCSQQSPEEQLQHLSGYWEIESVEFPDGSKKEYSISTTIDYIEMDGTQGIRKKVHPRLDGTFKVTKDAESFTAKIEQDSLQLYYKTPYHDWKETVLLAKDSTLHVLNKEGNIYKYKKFSIFNFNE
ncbi:lipocalin-like domain-containing protein [Marixanthomonas spongiae]|uniref:Lipocalin-like domain-containing protein n=1 Tax=Marixanthomonas spongiae TaxID=2174845 RepID=A0A2U0HXI8_9FLAO|nr:lipocalin family protein [Marixanthomonas spongiae]PVW13584.1 hypothetical protein DDV96_12725 [Marixanthomonas spongiae]